jgi:hypothetical protein
MCAKLNTSLAVHRLAADLGLRPTESPVQVVLAYCHRSVKKFITEHGGCLGLNELLNLLANKLGTRIVEINDNEQLYKIQREYVNRGEKIFATLDQELGEDECYGITFKLQNAESWEMQYVSIIDCRGRKHQRRYHTKWHEIGHLLILTGQTRLAFRRTHDVHHPKSAEESLVDAIAGEFSFYRSLLAQHLKGEISFQKIEQIRVSCCPEASIYSAILNISKLWPTPCIWIEAQLGAKKSQENVLQHSFGFQEPAKKALRAVHTNANDAARAIGLGIIPNFRVPRTSVIYRVFEEGLPYADAHEDLAWWESSNGTRLTGCRVSVQAKRIGDSVHALIVPV